RSAARSDSATSAWGPGAAREPRLVGDAVPALASAHESRGRLRAADAEALGRGLGAADRARGARAGRARRPARLRLRVVRRAPLPQGVLALRGARRLPLRRPRAT